MSEDTKLQQLIINTLSPEQMPLNPSETEIYLVEDDAEYATVEELATKQDVITDLGDIRNNIATNTSNISYLDEKVRDIELFKFPNAVIIGEPTISNGQVSGFSADNYMQFPFILDLHNTPFQIDFAFTTGNNVTTQQNILDSEFGLALAIANGKGLMAISGNGTSWNIGSSVGTIAIQPNTTYYAKLTWDGMQYKTLISTNGTDYTQDMYLVGTQRPYPRTIFIGGCSGSVIGHTPHPFFGSINMNKAYLYTRGQVIWQGMDDAGLATRADISLSNLDELGERRFTDKQDVITDLDTIRDGASKGATALQTIPIARANVVGGVAGGNWLTVNQTTGKMECGELTLAQYNSALGYTFISKTTLENRLVNKQDKLVSGTNIKTINGESVLGEGNFDVSSIEPLSQEEYDRRKKAGELDENKYYSTPTDISLQVLEILYPVGSLYLTTTSTCPLATLGIGTWQLEAADRVLQGAGSRGSVGTTINESLPNIKGESQWCSPDTNESRYNVSGVFDRTKSTGVMGLTWTSESTGYYKETINASRVSSTYQDGAPVQQDAYLINVFRRIA